MGTVWAVRESFVFIGPVSQSSQTVVTNNKGALSVAFSDGTVLVWEVSGIFLICFIKRTGRHRINKTRDLFANFSPLVNCDILIMYTVPPFIKLLNPNLYMRMQRSSALFFNRDNEGLYRAPKQTLHILYWRFCIKIVSENLLHYNLQHTFKVKRADTWNSDTQLLSFFTSFM